MSSNTDQNPKNPNLMTQGEQKKNSHIDGLITPEEYKEEMKKFHAYNNEARAYMKIARKIKRKIEKQYKQDAEKIMKEPEFGVAGRDAVSIRTAKMLALDCLHRDNEKRLKAALQEGGAGDEPINESRALEWSNAIIMRMKPFLSRNVQSRSRTVINSDAYERHYNYLAKLTDASAATESEKAQQRKKEISVARKRHREETKKRDAIIRDVIQKQIKKHRSETGNSGPTFVPLDMSEIARKLHN